MQAGIAGASGLIGQALLKLLLEHPRVERITSWVRRASGLVHAKLDERVVAFEHLEAALADERATRVFCCLGTTAAKAGSDAAFRRVDKDYPLGLARGAKRAGADAFLVVTAMGASPNSKIFYNRVKGELEQELTPLGLPGLHIFRPSLLLGERAEYRMSEHLAASALKPLSSLMLGPLRKYRPIEAEAVARAMLNVALDEPLRPGRFIYPSDQIARLGQQARQQEAG